ncbi:hypothetical protein NW765_001371 [Fusarium oxysporum]|nr:hypothetical protein FOWG_09903 [Fusarium oxysporum f. sp. lycopersici MN25]KAJ4125597.1 hypothetical protein NW765_001371 [Fusarium oxysporum]KAJ4264171.1 hypothetical protein NW764_015935 [Fusarium oxysporum]
MSFGFGVGDIIKAVELCHKLRRDFAEAPRQFQEINEEIRNLSIVLGDVDVCISNEQLSDKDRQDLAQTARECRNILDDLADIASRNQVLPNRSSADGAKRVWKRLKWNTDDVRDIRGRISSNIALLNAFHHRIARNNTAKLLQHTKDEELQKVLDWLCPADYGAQQSDLIARWQPNTGQWLLNSPEFQHWLDTPSATLFCPGIPGAGKTIMTSVVVDHLLSRPEHVGAVGIAYIYFNFRRTEEQTFTHLIASLVKQLARQRPCAGEELKSMYTTYSRGNTRPPTGEIVKILHAIAALPSFSRIFVVVDALDECQSSGNLGAKFLSELFRLQHKRRVNLFATSRFIPEIQNAFNDNGAIQVDIRASDNDIHTYIVSVLSMMPGCVRRSSQLQSEIITTILGAVNGMFLLAQIYATLLEDKLTTKAVKRTLSYFREQGSRSRIGEEAKLLALSHAYDQALERIQNQRPGRRELAQKALMWIVYARRPLTTVELTHALAIDETQMVLEEDNIPELEDIISVCNGLLVVDEESKIARLVHYTTQQYFEQKRECWFPNAEWTVAKACLATLMTAEWPLASLQLYGAEHWGHHLSSAPICTQRKRQVIEFLQLDNLAEFFTPSMAWGISEALALHCGDRDGFEVNSLHIAAHFGLSEAIDELLAAETNPSALDIEDSYHRPPIFYAIRSGNQDAVRVLIRHGAKVEFETPWGLNPLAVAAKYGHGNIAQIMIDNGAQVDHASAVWWPFYRRTCKYTALSIAADGGYVETVRLLLANGADIEYENKMGEMAIFVAATAGHVEVMQLLVENGADIESANRFMTTPLMQACRYRNHEAVKLLIRCGANVERVNNDDETAMSIAVTNGDEPILIALLEAGARFDDGSFFDKTNTPLRRAAKQGHVDMVRLLLSKGAVVEANYKFVYRHKSASEPRTPGFTPLLEAAYWGHASVSSVLLDYNANIEAKDTSGLTPLLVAASQERYEVMKVLVDRGADIHARDITSRNALYIVWSKRRSKEVAKLLLIKGAKLRRRWERRALTDWLNDTICHNKGP